MHWKKFCRVLLVLLFPATVLCSLAERFAMSEVAQSALCCHPMQRALELYSRPDAAAHGKLFFFNVDS